MKTSSKGEPISTTWSENSDCSRFRGLLERPGFVLLESG